VRNTTWEYLTLREGCGAMCQACPLSSPIITTVVLLTVFTLAAMAFLHIKGLLGYGRVHHAVLGKAAVSRSIGAYELLTAGTQMQASDKLLLVSRLASFLFCLVVMLRGIALGQWEMAAFTIWNYTTLVVVQGLLLAHSIGLAAGEDYHVPHWLSCVTWTLFQIELPNAILLDIIFWVVLWDFDANGAPDFQNINVHGVNALVLLWELWHNRIVFVWGQGVWVAAYVIAYCGVSWLRYVSGAQMPYAFMDVGSTLSPLVYTALALAFVLAFLLCYVLSLVKQRMKMQHLADSAINGYEKLRP